MLLFRSRHVALNSPLGHFNGDNSRLSTRRTKLTVTPRFISPNGNMAFAKLRRTQSLARPTTRAAFSNLSYPHFVSILTAFLRDLQHQKQTKYSMLQIKSIPKHISTLTSWTFSFMYPINFSEGITNLARKQQNVNINTHTYVTPSSSLKTKPLAKT